jgi:hypothetical protein
MTLARVVSFDGVDQARMDQLRQEIEQGDPPDGLSASEIMVLHDPEAQKSLAIVFFENEDDYQRGHETLDAMPAEGTPGNRTSVSKYQVAVRRTA